MHNRFIMAIHVFSWLLLGCLAGCSKGTQNPPGTNGDNQTVTYQTSNAIFPNPERGFIHTYNTLSDNNVLDAGTLATLRSRNVSLILRIVYLQEYKDRSIGEDKLAAIQADLDKIRAAGLKTILRFAYTDDMEGTDAPIAVVEQHLDQLKPLFQANEDIIAFVQAGFIGAWGEWHSSSNNLASPENQKRVLSKLLEVVPAKLMVQVRTPVMKQRIFDTAQPVTQQAVDSGSPLARVGHHNDCFLSNATDYGTYTDGQIEAEKQYIRDDALFVPTGGETCPPTDGFSPDCPEGRNQMKFLRWTYLNLDWYEPTINLWRASGCFDEFQRNLGYRLALESSEAPLSVAEGKGFPLTLHFTNSGYAPMYHQKSVDLILKNKATGSLHAVALSCDLRRCKPGQKVTFEEQPNLTGIPAGTYELFLNISDSSTSLKDRPEYAIRLANEAVWQDETGLNSLLRQLTVE
ncbi:hypothetical protein GCM10011386_06900 [Parapedobacter defluvii]|uniref:DUF4832 domain-containing protein n=2 Tax=Parapedobacter defluvii TaxID=2045106 RepID=A0ABQ1L216_9SPHI|nr:hypothetical protein GCM10011386_06900 [Parapedobacter defluvii]